MENTQDNRIVLAIESAVRGGSICLLRGETVIDKTEGNNEVSRAEDLLPNIARLLESSGVDKKDVGLIAVSNGPGSYTGIRIGIATALGLSRSLGTRCVGISSLEAMAVVFSSSDQVAAAIPFGKSDVCVQTFRLGGLRPTPSSEATIINAADFPGFIADRPEIEILVHSDLFDGFSERENSDFRGKIIEAVPNLAFAIGVAAQRISDLSAPEALYLRNPRFVSGGV